MMDGDDKSMGGKCPVMHGAINHDRKASDGLVARRR